MQDFSRQVLVVDDDDAVRHGIARALSRLDLAVSTAASGQEALAALARQPAGIVLLDIRLPDADGHDLLALIRQDWPDTRVIMITGYPTIPSAVQCIQQGALDYLVKPFRLDDLEALVNQAREQLAQRGARQPDADDAQGLGLDFIIGRSPAMQKVYDKIRRAAPSDSTVLLMGESGTGKELAARAIHLLSMRRDKEFVPVDCSALVESLLESELFGHVKGSFTGAIQTKHGLFELANHGTFFFDEISNLSLNIQAKLLRVIQEREFMKVGSQKRIRLDIRIIASSNRDLKDAVQQGDFREDLFYRLSVIPIHLPPLRERPEDIPLLVDHFIKKYSQKANREVVDISSKALKLLAAYPWPGNVRELEHTIERIVILEDGEVIQPEHLPSFITQRPGELLQLLQEGGSTLEEMERRLIEAVLQRTRGRRQEAAQILGINRKTLLAKIKKYHLPGHYSD